MQNNEVFLTEAGVYDDQEKVQLLESSEHKKKLMTGVLLDTSSVPHAQEENC